MKKYSFYLAVWKKLHLSKKKKKKKIHFSKEPLNNLIKKQKQLVDSF